MTKKDTVNRDTFALSRGGMTAVVGYTMMPAVAHDRLRQVISEETDACRRGKSRARRFLAAGRRQTA